MFQLSRPHPAKAMDFHTRLPQLASEEFCYLTTTGRRSGQPHEIEIWFTLLDGTLYMLSGGGRSSDWVRNLLEDPAVTVRIAQQTFPGRARLVQDAAEERLARYRVAEKYGELEEGQTLSQWARTALPVAVDLHFIGPLSGSS